MIERNQEDRRRTEETFELLKQAIQPVLNGEREIIDILSVEKHHMTGMVTIKFFPVPGILGDRGRKVFEMLKHELGYDASLGSKPETRELDYYHNERYQEFPTNREIVVLVKSKIYEEDPKDPERITWSIKHLRPKQTRIQKVGTRARQIASRVSRLPWPN